MRVIHLLTDGHEKDLPVVAGMTVSASGVGYVDGPVYGLEILNTRGPPLMVGLCEAFSGWWRNLFLCDRRQDFATLRDRKRM